MTTILTRRCDTCGQTTTAGDDLALPDGWVNLTVHGQEPHFYESLDYCSEDCLQRADLIALARNARAIAERREREYE